MKRRLNAATRVSKAQAELTAAERDLATSLLPWKRPLQKRRSAIALIGGFSAGLALALLPSRWWARAGAALGTTAASAARSALAPAIIGVLASHVLRGKDAGQKVAPGPATAGMRE